MSSFIQSSATVHGYLRGGNRRSAGLTALRRPSPDRRRAGPTPHGERGVGGQTSGRQEHRANHPVRHFTQSPSILFPVVKHFLPSRIKSYSYLTFKICSTIKKVTLLFNINSIFTFQYKLLLIFYTLSISILSLIPMSNTQPALLTEGVVLQTNSSSRVD
jgi:hypothetical protein